MIEENFMTSLNWSTGRFVVALTAVLSTAACSDNPVQPDEHPEAGGVVILDADGAVLARSVGESVAFDQPIVLGAGTVTEVTILFLDADDPDNLGSAFAPDDEEGQSLRVTIGNEAVAEYQDHGDHGDLAAVAAGQTTAVIDLMHGSHSDFQSGLLTITVE